MNEWSKVLLLVYITTIKYTHDFPKDTWTVQGIRILLLNLRIDHGVLLICSWDWLFPNMPLQMVFPLETSILDRIKECKTRTRKGFGEYINKLIVGWHMSNLKGACSYLFLHRMAVKNNMLYFLMEDSICT